MAQAGAPEFSSQVQSLHRSCTAENVNAFNVLIADDSPSIRQVVRSHLEQNPDWYVCGEAENGYTVVELVRQLKPDGVVLDFSMPGMNGLEAAQQIAAISPNTRVVLFTAHDGGILRAHAATAGIKAVVGKDGKASLDAVQRALRGDDSRPA